jgi:hypothetical protein
VTRWAAWLLAGVAVAALAFGGFHLLGQVVRGAPEPDLAAFASSSLVRTNDKLAGAWLRRQADRFAGQATWLTLAGHGLADECSGSGGGAGMLGGSVGASVSCQRADTWFFAVPGDKAARLAHVEQILSKTDGWGKFTDVPVGAASPPVLAVTSAAWVGPAGPRPPSGKVGLDLIWVERQQELAAAVLGAQLSQASADRVRYLQVLRPDLGDVARKGFGPHRHVLVVSFVDSYFAGHSLTPPAPVASENMPEGNNAAGGGAAPPARPGPSPSAVLSRSRHGRCPVPCR